MKKIYSTLILLFFLNLTFAQWTKIASVPSTDIVSLKVNNNIIYALTGRNIIYKSSDGGVAWTPIVVSNNPIDITDLAFYNNKMYVGTYRFGVFVSPDNGTTWQNNGSNPLWISEFAIKNNVLYASTLGNGVAIFNSNTNSWSSFNNSIPNYSVNVWQIIASPNFLMISAGANGTFYKYDFNINNWTEGFYYGILRPGLLIEKLINKDDTVFAVNFNRIIKSNNAGTSWQDDKIGTHSGGTNRIIYAGSENHYTLTNLFPSGTWIQQRNKYADIGTTWAIGEELLPDGYSYDIIEYNKTIFLGKTDGLYFKNLSVDVTTPLPVHFSSFNTSCDENKVAITWKTEQEKNSDHFGIEKSTDGVHWTVIGNVPAAGNSNTETSYSYNDNQRLQNAYYRVGEYDLDGKIYYTNTLRTTCVVTESFKLWPNPVRDYILINIVAVKESQAFIKMFDSKGSLVKMQKASLTQGSNQLTVFANLLAAGIYSVHVEWNNGLTKKTVLILKE